ncbi:MAG: hypothetical protein JWM35_51 [Verrucomicrobia bacterium]|nr:hypothetical protein [Verrucomicrobiota bacterium]
MDLPLILAAQSFQLAPDLQHSEAINGVQVVKNASTKTLLRITKAQWRILEFFAEPRSVPTVLAQALEARACLPLEEFYELILKAVRARILIEPGLITTSAPVHGWRFGVRAKTVVRPLVALFFVGIILLFVSHPSLPSSILDVIAGVVVVSAAMSLASVVTACVIQGSGGEVLPLPWHWWRLPPCFAIDSTDAAMLPLVAQQAAAITEPAILATAAGILALVKPSWNFIPVVALAISIRPIFGGKFIGLIRFNRSVPLSDAEHNYLFPPNHRPKKRWDMLRRAVRHPDTWARLAYGIVWTLGLIYLAGRLADTPPWSMDFWEENGHRVALAIWGSLAALGSVYLVFELYHLTRQHVRSRRSLLRRLHRRWIGGKKLVLLEVDRMRAVNESPVFRPLPPLERQNIAKLMEVTRHGAWKPLPEYGPVPTKVSLIVAGQIGLYRKAASGQLNRVQVLSEGDIVGLHDVADPKNPEYFARTITPVTLFTFDRALADDLLVKRVPRSVLTNTLLKLPFLRQISLCRNWHFQAVERFAALSALNDISEGSVIFPENQFNQDFFVIFENHAEVSRHAKRVAVIGAGDFFGEIGLLQNSPSTAQVSAQDNTRVLSIDRSEFLRFVTHNYTVALELERVSSKRLGHPIFPLRKANLRTT